MVFSIFVVFLRSTLRSKNTIYFTVVSTLFKKIPTVVYVAASRKYLIRIQTIFMLLESPFHKLFCLKFSFKLVTFSKSYARKQKWVFFSEHSVQTVSSCDI